MDGTVVRLDDYRGKAVVVNFWASWCIPCAVEYPQMVRLASFYPEDLVIVAVSVDADRSAIDRFIARFGGPPANFLIAHDPEKKIAQDVFGTVNLPESYLIDAAQILRDKIIGASVAWDGPEMRARIEALRPAQDAPL